MPIRKNTVLIKRSNVVGLVPITGQIQLGELAINTADVKLYASGTTSNSILPIGWDRIARTGDTMSGTLISTTLSASTISGGTFFGNGSNLNLGRVSFCQTATGNVSGTTNEVTLLSAGTGSLVIPSSKLTIGKSFRISAAGVLSTDTANPTTTTYRLKFGSTTIAATTGIFQGATITNRVWEVKSVVTIRSTGATGTVMTTGMYQDNNSNGNTLDNGTTPVVVNMTTGVTVNFTMQFTQTATGNKMSLLTFLFEEVF